MALPPIAKIGLIFLGGAVIYGAHQYFVADRRQISGQTPPSDLHPLSGTWVPGATLGNNPRVVKDIMLPVQLSTAPEIKTRQGDIVQLPSGNIDNKDVLAQLLTNLSPQATDLVYELMLMNVATHGRDLSDPATRDQTIQEVLSAAVKKVDWTQGLMPFAFGSPEADVWVATQMLGEIAHQSFFNKVAAGVA